MQELFVKISGITSLDDALHAVRCKADAVGFVFTNDNVRALTTHDARNIIAGLPEHISKVGVFLGDELSYVQEIVGEVPLSAVQLHGSYGPDDLVNFDTSVIKAFDVGEDFDVEVLRNYIVDALLLNASHPRGKGNKGKAFEWNVALRAKEYGKVILAGGLTPENVEGAVRFVRPYGVSVCRGVERWPGSMDPDKVREFIARAKGAVVPEANDEGEWER
jgi:phosphoribosylanthranilate isomerase